MTLIWLALCRPLTVDKCSPTTLLSTCRRYEITYFVHSENSQEILWITFTKTHLQIYQTNHSTLLQPNLFLPSSQWHATLNQSSHEQLVCLKALLVDEFPLFLSMLHSMSRTLIPRETSRQKNSFVNKLTISQTRSSRCWTSLNLNETWLWNSTSSESLFKSNMTRDWIN